MEFAKVERRGQPLAFEVVLRLRDVEAMTGRRRSSVYEDIAAGRLPRPIKIGPRAVGWLRSDIEQWQAGIVAARAAEVEARKAGRAPHGGGAT
jgi:prophage regulatory protein